MIMRKVSNRRRLSWPGVPLRARVALLGAALLLLATAHNAAAQCRNEYFGGLDDNFTPPSEPTMPDPGLTAFCSSGKDFDDSVNNSCLAHTFPALGTICGATLCFRAKPTGDAPANDSMSLGNGPPFTYSVALKNLPEAGGTWNATDNPSGAVFCLDLANLPNNGTNLIPTISGADLDVYMQDDTQVDYMTLTTTCCGCDKTHPAGISDNFAAPPEPTTPNAALAAFPCGTFGSVDFDDPASDQCVKHTFEDLGVICGATLTVRLKPTAGGSTNDKLALYADEGVIVPGLYSSFIYDLPNANPPVTPGIWDTTNNPTGSTFVLDLANLPPSGTNVINQINQAGLLDVLVEDDSAVDYITLETTCCPHQKCYKIKAETQPPSSATIRTLEDQFGIKSTTIKLKPYLLCTPVDKGGEDDRFDEKNHTVCYKIKEQPPFPDTTVGITNQFGSGPVRVLKPLTLCVPSSKTLRHCVGGANDGGLCTTASECPGGTCQF